MSEEREKVYQILELGKHLKNLHHKKGYGGLLFIDLSMLKFSILSSYIRQLDKENQELKLELSGYRQAILEDKDMLGLKEENTELKKQLEKYENELEKADSITQSCIFNGKKESEISYRKCLNMLEKHKNQQKEFINYLEDMLDDENDIFSVVRVKDVLQKYKSIIGDDE